MTFAVVPDLTKDAADLADPNPVEPTHVMNQMRKNFPEKAIEWMADARWIGPVEIPQDRIDYDDVDTWAASREPGAVKRFAKAIKHGTGHTQPVVAVQEPGEAKVKVIDGHHRTLAYKRLGRPVKAYVGFVDHNGGVWDKTQASRSTRTKTQPTRLLRGIRRRCGSIGLGRRTAVRPTSLGRRRSHGAHPATLTGVSGWPAST